MLLIMPRGLLRMVLIAMVVLLFVLLSSHWESKKKLSNDEIFEVFETSLNEGARLNPRNEEDQDQVEESSTALRSSSLNPSQEMAPALNPKVETQPMIPNAMEPDWGGQPVIFPKELSAAAQLRPSKVIFAGHGTFDSKVQFFQDDPRKYRVCKFSNFCLNSTHIILSIDDPEQKKELESILTSCEKGETNDPACACFSPLTSHAVITQSQKASLPYLAGQHWILDKYSTGKQVGYFLEAAGLMHSVLLEAQSYGIKDLKRVVLRKDPLPLTNHEENILSIGLKAAGSPISMIGMNDIDRDSGACFQEGFLSSVMGRIATNQKDADLFRLRAFEHFSFALRDCPPRRTIFLSQPKGQILNEDELEIVLRKFQLVDLVKVTLSSANSSREYAELFNRAGLIVSPHTSDLANLVFSHPKSTVIQVAPVIYNYDFAQLGIDLNILVWFSVGGAALDLPTTPEVDACVQLFRNCVGEPRCCRQVEKQNPGCTKSSSSSFADYSKRVKKLGFRADPKAFERVVKEMVKKLNVACGGKWAGTA